MEHIFLQGPLDLKAELGQLFDRSKYIQKIIGSYLLYGTEVIPLVETNIASRLRHQIQHPRYITNAQSKDKRIMRMQAIDSKYYPQMINGKMVSIEYGEYDKVIWEVPDKLKAGQWICLLIDQDLIVGTYKGEIDIDSEGRWYSHSSFIEIRSDYRGKGLCKQLAFISYSQLLALEIAYIWLIIEPKGISKIAACNCYVAAAKQVGMNVIYDNYMAEKCTEDVSVIILVAPEIEADQVMIDTVY